jgi:hypothetical protein
MLCLTTCFDGASEEVATAGVGAAWGFDLGIQGLGVAVPSGAGDATMAAMPVGRRWVPARRLFFTVVAATLWATAAANGAAGALGAGGCGAATTSVLTSGRPERSMPAIPAGCGAEDEGEREIGGGGGRARAREGNELKCPCPPTGGRGYRLGLSSVRGIGDSRFGPQIFSASLKSLWFWPFYGP